MDNQKEKKGRDLTSIEEKEFREGMALYEMDQGNLGWQIVKRILTDVAFHSWVDPRETDEKEKWVWQELNAFHAANNAKELLEAIQKMISRADYLGKVKSGEIQVKKFNI